MKFSKRKFTKILSFSVLALLFPIKILLAATKKIINPNLSKEQKISCLMKGLKDRLLAIY